MSIRIAYLLLVHKNPEQVNLFLRQLQNYGPCDIYIHVDRKAEKLADQLEKGRNIHICSIYNVRWGSIEIVKAALALMNQAMESDTAYTHIYFGSGADLLVKKGLYEYLEQHEDSVFLKIEQKVSPYSRASARWRIRWPKCLMVRNDYHIYRFVRIALQCLCRCGIVLRRNKKQMEFKTIYQGRTWFLAPCKAVEEICRYVRKHPEYLEFWEESLASDLMFFQTILMHSKYRDKIEDELMYVKFGTTFGTSNHPLDITMEDIPELDGGNYFFARKFDLEKQKAVMLHYVQKLSE